MTINDATATFLTVSLFFVMPFNFPALEKKEIIFLGMLTSSFLQHSTEKKLVQKMLNVCVDKPAEKIFQIRII